MSHSFRGSDGTEAIQIAIKCDGTYQKRGDRSRGYTSKLGITVIFDADTDLPLDYAIECKYCHTCTQERAKFTNDDDYKKWSDANPHNCEKNFDQPSSEMERHSLLQMFN